MSTSLGSIGTTSTALKSTANTADSRSVAISRSYHEMGDHSLPSRHVVEVSALETFRANLARLEDLHGRLRYMMGELSYLLKKS